MGLPSHIGLSVDLVSLAQSPFPRSLPLALAAPMECPPGSTRIHPKSRLIFSFLKHFLQFFLVSESCTLPGKKVSVHTFFRAHYCSKFLIFTFWALTLTLFHTVLRSFHHSPPFSCYSQTLASSLSPFIHYLSVSCLLVRPNPLPSVLGSISIIQSCLPITRPSVCLGLTFSPPAL
ncbi:hypothetical protein DIRU0_A07294 [Diutina rugosa]